MERKIDRLDKYMIHKGLNDNKITVMCSITVGLLGKSRKEGRDLSDRVIEIILNKFPDLNRVWLITGHGDMLNEEIPDKSNLIESNSLVESSNEVFANKLMELFQTGQIYPASIVAEKDAKIGELNREIGRLEARIKEIEFQKNNVHPEDNAGCAVAK